MKNIKKLLLSPWISAFCFVLALVLLSFGSVGGARAALTYISEYYSSRVQMFDIGVTLVENDEDVSWRNYNSIADGTWEENTGVLLENMLEEGETVKPGQTYKEELRVRNSGTINHYLRVNVYKYWMKDGKKMQDLSPDLIDLHLVNLDSDWLLDEEASTPERTVLYYNKLLNAGDETPLFADTLTIDGFIATKVTQNVVEENGYTTITTVYDYDGVQFCLEAEVDAVQEHNAEDAIWSAWGRKVSVADKSLSLN